MSENCVICERNRVTSFVIIDTKLYVPVVTISTQDNAKLLQHLKSGFKRTSNWNKYQSRTSTEAQNRCLDYLINPSFQGVNRLFVLLFKNQYDRIRNTGYYLPTVKIKDYNVKIDTRNLFDEPMVNDIKIYENIRKIATGQGDDYTTCCLLNYLCFKEKYKMIAIVLSLNNNILMLILNLFNRLILQET